ncbi:type 2 lanthipeptide synthetase LanM family protein [Planosporangium sp. 12N6]|uniref:type 2 lanthipeptide synthetase LanM family protein n=1 Tax=Planosporangium spinosum TaxID=3402278 RepID=UPI003CF9C047
MLPARPGGTPLVGYWWAPGLTLAERLAVPPSGRFPLPDGRPDGPRRFAARVADLGLDEAHLHRLLREPLPALAARMSRPGWAAAAEELLAAAPYQRIDPAPDGGRSGGDHHPPSGGHRPPDGAHRPPDTDRPPDTVPVLESFSAALHPLVADAADRLVARVAGVPETVVDLAAVRAGFAVQVGHRLARLAARTLVLELHTARTAGRLRGDDGRQRFADFLRQTATRPGLAELFRTYPVLARLLVQGARYAVDAHAELLARYRTDRAAVVADLLGGADPGPLVAADNGAGDAHGRGRSVAVLRFADGRAVVYKPRPLTLHVHFTELVRWLGQRVPDLALRTVATLPRDGYGWQEFVPALPCRDADDVERFYRRLGALLALLYAVDAADMHCENIIACGDQPVPVDVETLFHPNLPLSGALGPDPAAEALASSVSRTALLPRPIAGDAGAADLSGLGGDAGAALPVPVVAWDAAATDEMRLTRRTGRFAGARNRPTLDGDPIDPADHRASLLSGFRAGYRAIAAAAADFADLLRGCARDEIRIVLRPTQLYQQVLDESTHPEVLRDALEREHLFDVLWSSVPHPAASRLLPYETDDLWAGDVPLVTGRPGSRDLWTASGQRLPDMLDVAPLTATLAKVGRMGEVDLRDQEWIVSSALATRRPDAGHGGAPVLPGPVVATAPGPDRMLAAACGIGDQLVARALRAGDRANWLSLELVDDRQWTLLPMGAGLAEGYCGVALFLAQLARLSRVDRYAELARQAMRPVPLLLEFLADRSELVDAVGCGGFRGLGGIAYALARFHTLTGDPDIRECLPAAVGLAAAAAHRAGPAGIATGLAGCLAAMSAVHAETGLDAAAALARTCADRLAGLVERAGGVPAGLPAGFLDGAAGVGWALARAAARGDDRYRDAATTLLHGRPAASGGAPDSTAVPVGGRPDGTVPVDGGLGWCTGAAGALMSHVDCGEGAGPDCPAGDARRVAALEAAPLRHDLSLCHGELGAVEALTVLAERGDEEAARAQRTRAGLIAGALDRYGPLCGTPDAVPSPGLLTGLAGIGYGLLRLGFPAQVPSVLLLAPTPKPRR